MLWLFTDALRLPDPTAAAARLPRGLCGVVLRHDELPAAARAALGRRLARICRARRNCLVVAGDWRLATALGAGVHLRGGRGRRARGLATGSAHGMAELVAARRAGVALAFLSPAFATASHAGAAGLGACRWARLAGRARTGVGRVRFSVAALGGVDGASIRRLGAGCAAAGAIGALG